MRRFIQTTKFQFRRGPKMRVLLCVLMLFTSMGSFAQNYSVIRPELTRPETPAQKAAREDGNRKVITHAKQMQRYFDSHPTTYGQKFHNGLQYGFCPDPNRPCSKNPTKIVRETHDPTKFHVFTFLKPTDTAALGLVPICSGQEFPTLQACLADLPKQRSQIMTEIDPKKFTVQSVECLTETQGWSPR